MSMTVTMYFPPFGTSREVEITNIHDADAAWFIANNVKISMEEIGGHFAVYADIGRETDDGDDDELIELSEGRSCEETMAALRKSCKAALAEAEDDEDEICSGCSGSGEGMYDGSTCYKCHGSGVEPGRREDDDG